MSNIAIRVENLGKQYHIGRKQERYQSLRDTITDAFVAPFRRVRNLLRGQATGAAELDQAFWALQDISFEVKPGEVLGIIGRNGAGQTTLLKIQSRITEPSVGVVDIYGRIGSLLEVGTGFHPELTGRENVYLNGAILGMTRADIERKFDEIVAFAEVQKFIDTPVKHYSSGMYLRLAFAVAAYLEPEILLVDEVLAVGDAEFQKKCLGKVGDVAHQGRTVLFVSHNMGAMNTLCDRVIWLDKGAILQDGQASRIVSAYLNSGRSSASQKVWSENERPGNRSFKLLSVTLKNAAGEITSEIHISECATVEIEYEVIESGARAMFSLVLWDANSNVIFGSLSNTEENRYHAKPLQKGCYRSACQLYGNLLNDGRHYISIIGTAANWSDGFRADHVISFETLEDGILKRDYPGQYGGVIRPKLRWQTNPISMKG